jgi:glycopeptide antibiotics resistance protein
VERSHAGPASHDQAERRVRGIFLVVALAWTAFCLYGSLVPLRFTALPIEDAVQQYLALLRAPLKLRSSADAGTNFLLLLPSAFFWTGALWPRQRASRAVVVAAVWGALVAFAFLLEFLQLFVVGRTSSQVDVAAQIIGVTAGVFAWLAAGGAVTRWALDTARSTRPAGLAEQLLLVYLAAVVFYALLPLDLSLHPADWYRKWRAGRVILLPFLYRDQTLEFAVYSALSEIAIWIPIGALIHLRRPSGLVPILGRAVVMAVLLESLQLLVRSRTTDVNDIAAAAIGACAGALLVRFMRPSAPVSALRDANRLWTSCVVWAAVFALWFAGVAALYWYPFDFNLSSFYLRRRIAAVSFVPFQTYYWTTPFNAVSELLRRVLLFLPAGILVGWWFERLLSRRVIWLAGVSLIAVAAVTLEVGQLALRGRFADPTDAALGIAGGILGVFVMSRMRHDRRQGRASTDERAEPL